MKKKFFIFKSLLCLGLLSFFAITGCAQRVETVVYYSVKYHSNYGNTPETIKVLSGSVLTSEQLPDLSDSNHTFLGWYDETEKLVVAEKFTVTKNITLEAGWKKNSSGNSDNTSTYTVNYYFQKTDESGYSLSVNDTENLSGISGEITSVQAKTFEGFIAKEITQKEIASDGSTVIEIYYDRKTIVLTFDTDGGNEIEPLSGLYGTVVSAPENPKRTDFEFAGWDKEIPEKFLKDMTFKALWNGNYVSGISFKITQNDISVIQKGNCLTADDGYVSYVWYINGAKQSENSNKMYVPCKSGIYEISLIAKDADANIYTFAATLKIGSDDKNFVKVAGCEISKTTNTFVYFADDYSIKVDDFYICSHEVTQKEYYEIMKDNPSANSVSVEQGEIQENRPVDSVSWYMAIAYCNARSAAEGLEPCYSVNGSTDFYKSTIPVKLDDNWNDATCDTSKNGYRLPTEAEWEIAARGGVNGIAADSTVYSGSSELNSVGWYAANSSSKSHEVAEKKANALGLFDFNGNITELCNDVYYATVSTTNDSGLNRVCRGGDYSSNADKCEINTRSSIPPFYKGSGTLGMRLVRSTLE